MGRHLLAIGTAAILAALSPPVSAHECEGCPLIGAGEIRSLSVSLKYFFGPPRAALPR